MIRAAGAGHNPREPAARWLRGRMRSDELTHDPGPGGLAAVHPPAEARLRSLIAAEFDFVWRSLRRLGVRDGDADDAAQRVFLITSKKLDQVAAGSERSFLFGVALRVAGHARRGYERRRESEHDEVSALLDGAPSPEEALDERRARAVADALLDEMPMELRAVFVLFEVEEMTMAQIAELLGLPPGTVASRLRRAREDFQARLRRLRAQQTRGGLP